MVSVRKARAEDCERILDLIRDLAVYEREPDAVTVSSEHFLDAGFGKNPVWEAFVAEIDGMIIGFALWYIRYSTWKGRRLYLEDFYVDPEYRRTGTGKMLFDRVIEFAVDNGYSGMAWQALSWNEPALSFYRKYDAKLDDGWTNCSLDFDTR